MARSQVFLGPGLGQFWKSVPVGNATDRVVTK